MDDRMRITLVGVKEMDFFADDGAHIQGVKLYYSRKPINKNEQDGLTGLITGEKFIKPEASVFKKIPKQLKLGAEYDFIYISDGRNSVLFDIEEVGKSDEA